jgi:hypothetical protein
LRAFEAAQCSRDADQVHAIRTVLALAAGELDETALATWIAANLADCTSARSKTVPALSDDGYGGTCASNSTCGAV